MEFQHFFTNLKVNISRKPLPYLISNVVGKSSRRLLFLKCFEKEYLQNIGLIVKNEILKNSNKPSPISKSPGANDDIISLSGLPSDIF